MTSAKGIDFRNFGNGVRPLTLCFAPVVSLPQSRPERYVRIPRLRDGDWFLILDILSVLNVGSAFDDNCFWRLHRRI